MRRRRHVCSWTLVATEYTPPDPEVRAANSSGGAEWARLLERIVFGVSTVTQRCSECGYIDVRTVTGRVKT